MIYSRLYIFLGKCDRHCAPAESKIPLHILVLEKEPLKKEFKLIIVTGISLPKNLMSQLHFIVINIYLIYKIYEYLIVTNL